MSALLASWFTLWAGTVFNEHPKCEDTEGVARASWCEFVAVVVGLSNFLVFVALLWSFFCVKIAGTALERQARLTLRQVVERMRVEVRDEPMRYSLALASGSGGGPGRGKNVTWFENPDYKGRAGRDTVRGSPRRGQPMPRVGPRNATWTTNPPRAASRGSGPGNATWTTNPHHWAAKRAGSPGSETGEQEEPRDAEGGALQIEMVPYMYD